MIHPAFEEAQIAFSRALELASKGQLPQALPAFEIACRLCPDSVLYRAENALALWGMGHAQATLDEVSVVLGLLARESATANQDPYLFHRLGLLHSIVLGDEQKALSFFEQSCQLAPDDLDYLLAAATSLAKLGLPDEAAELAQRGADLIEGTVPIGPRAASDRCRLARLLAPLDPALATMLSGQGVAEAPDDPMVRKEAGAAALATDDFESALTHYQKAADLAPGWPLPLGGVQHALMSMGLFEDAVGVGLDILADCPEFSAVRLNTGLAMLDQGRFADADSMFEALVLENEDDALAHASLGLCYAAQHRAPEARRHQARALHLAPDDPEIERISAEIDRLLDDGGDGGVSANQKKLALALMLLSAMSRRRQA